MIRRALLGVLVLLALTTQAEAWTFTGRYSQGANAGAGVTTATVVPTSIAVGNLVVVAVDCDPGVSGITKVEDTLGNAYTPVSATQLYNSNAGSLRLFYSVATVGGTSPTLTATFNATTSYGFVIASEYTPSGAVALDGTNFGTGAGTTYSSGAITTTGASDLIVGYVNGNGSAPATPATWTNRGGAALNVNLSDLLNQLASSYTYTAGSATAGWGAIIVAFSQTGVCVFGGGIIGPRCPG